MQILKIDKLEWRQAKNNSGFASINYNPQTKTGISCWAKKEDIEKYDLLNQGEEVEIEIKESGKYKNIIAIKKNGQIYKWDRNGNISFQNNEQPDSQSPTPIDNNIVDKNVDKNFEKEIQNSSEKLLQEINSIIKRIKENSDSLTERELTNLELKLGALDVEISQIHSKNNSVASQLDLEYKKERDKKIDEIKSVNGDISDTKAKAKAETALWENKSKLVVAQNKVKSNELISKGITNLLFAIKDKIKSIHLSRQ